MQSFLTTVRLRVLAPTVPLRHAAPRACARRAPRVCSIASESVSGSSTSSYVTENQRRDMAKLALYDVLPDTGISASVSAEVMEAVGERLLVLEHLCPISDPARQVLDGTWEVMYCNTTTPGLIAYRVLQSLPFPPGVATLQELKLHIEGSKLTVVAKIKLLDMLAELDLVSSLSAESDIRIRETYEKGVLKLPEMGSEGMMDQAETRLKSTPMPGNLITQALARATPMLQSLSEGFEVPLSGTFDRSMLVSYLDSNLMVARSLNGSPEVLRKLPVVLEPLPEVVEEEPVVEEAEAVEQITAPADATKSA